MVMMPTDRKEVVQIDSNSQFSNVIVPFVTLYMLVELVLTNNTKHLRKNEFAGMHEDFGVFVLKAPKLPLKNSNRKIK
jgi:hypothetical protein